MLPGSMVSSGNLVAGSDNATMGMGNFTALNATIGNITTDSVYNGSNIVPDLSGEGAGGGQQALDQAVKVASLSVTHVE